MLKLTEPKQVFISNRSKPTQFNLVWLFWSICRFFFFFFCSSLARAVTLMLKQLARLALQTSHDKKSIRNIGGLTWVWHQLISQKFLNFCFEFSNFFPLFTQLFSYHFMTPDFSQTLNSILLSILRFAISLNLIITTTKVSFYDNCLRFANGLFTTCTKCVP